jgi:gliding motility-associated-like protein
MKAILSIFFTLILFHNSFAQNLVPNPSFEDLNHCNTDTMDHYVINYDTLYPPAAHFACKDWIIPNSLGAVFLNRCTNTSNNAYHLPFTLTGQVVTNYQPARTGNGMAEIRIFYDITLWRFRGTCMRSYVQSKLKEKLKKDKRYCINFYINTPLICGSGCNQIVTDDVHIAITPERPTRFTPRLAFDIFTDCRVRPSSYLPIGQGVWATDTSKWYKLETILKAKGTEEWLTIGDFKDNQQTNRLYISRSVPSPTDSVQSSQTEGILFIDDVSVVEIAPPLNSTKDTVVCSFPFTLTANAGFTTYLWSTGATTQSITITQPGRYWIKVNSECGIMTDTIRILPQQTLTSRRDTTACLPALLTANPATTYLWNTNATTQSINITQAGKYWVKRQISPCSVTIDTFMVKTMDIQTTTHRDTTACLPTLLTAKTATTYLWNTAATTQNITATQAGKYWVRREIAPCVYRTDTIQVREAQPPLPLHFADTLLCTTDFPIRYAIPQVFTNIKWNDNTTDNPKTIAQSGIYTVAADWQCGTVRDTFRVVSESPLPPIRLLTQDTTSCTKGRFVPFRLYAPYGYPNYMWNTGATTRNIIIQKDGNYSVNSHNICGNVTDAIKIEGCPPNYYIPNTFTPNGDGYNDIFSVFTTDAIVNIKKMQVFDRWGEQIVAIQNVLPSFGGAGGGWDGTFKGQEAASDVYVYVIVLEFADGTTETVSGDVTLLR